VLAALVAAGPRPAAAPDARLPAIHITSPLGRTGLVGTLRVVARLDPYDGAPPARVSFYVDRQLLSTDTDGAPYEALWVDENPFEERELTAEAVFPSGRSVTDMVVLKPLEVTEAADVSSVVVDAAVLDASGHFVAGLTPHDFSLTENRIPQELDSVADRREPALVTLLVDSSQSMAIRAKAVRATAARIVDAIAPGDQVVVAPFAKSVVSVTGPTTDRQTVLDAITAIHDGGGTAIFDALREAASSLRGGVPRRSIVLITDGYDENSRSTVEQARSALHDHDIALYVLGLGGIAGLSLRGEDVLSQLAASTGGRAWFPRDERQLAAAYGAIAGDVAHRYVLTYTPRDQRRDGTWRAIHVSVDRPGLVVRARPGYTAPLPPPIRASIEFTAVGTGDTPVSVTRDDVAVFEDGVEQQPDRFAEAVLPVTIIMALDASGSMKRSASRVQEAARRFVLAMRPEDQIGLITFADTSNVVHAPTTRRDWPLDAIDKYQPAGGTALYDALVDALAELAHVDGRRVVVVVTDGVDENAESNGPGSVRTWNDVLHQLELVDATVYAVALGSRVDRARLEELAGRSGGAAYFPSDVSTMSATYDTILDELRRRYVIGYESTNHARDGQWRHVEIRPRGEGVAIRSRGGYYAPSP
jgi:VWFA-related protein